MGDRDYRRSALVEGMNDLSEDRIPHPIRCPPESSSGPAAELATFVYLPLPHAAVADIYTETDRQTTRSHGRRYTTPAGIVMVMFRRLELAVLPTRSDQVRGDRIQSGRPAGTSNSGISMRSPALKFEP